jgi:hypothetical protein
MALRDQNSLPVGAWTRAFNIFLNSWILGTQSPSSTSDARKTPWQTQFPMKAFKDNVDLQDFTIEDISTHSFRQVCIDMALKDSTTPDAGDHMEATPTLLACVVMTGCMPPHPPPCSLTTLPRTDLPLKFHGKLEQNRTEYTLLVKLHHHVN